jgi:selenocysteine lyase/cysteine desulfurase
MYEYQTRDDFNRIKRELSPKKLANSILMQAASRLMNRQVLDRIKQLANGEASNEKEEVKEKKTKKQEKFETLVAEKKTAEDQDSQKKEEKENE